MFVLFFYSAVDVSTYKNKMRSKSSKNRNKNKMKSKSSKNRNKNKKQHKTITSYKTKTITR